MTSKRAEIRRLLLMARMVLESDYDSAQNVLRQDINMTFNGLEKDSTMLARPREEEPTGRIIRFPPIISAKVPRSEKDPMVTSSKAAAMRLLRAYFPVFDHTFTYHDYSPAEKSTEFPNGTHHKFEISIRDMEGRSDKDWEQAKCYDGISETSWINAAADLIEKSGAAKRESRPRSPKGRQGCKV